MIIWPTRRGCLVLFSCLLWFGAAAISQNFVAYCMGCFAATAVFVSAILAFFTLPKCEFQRLGDAEGAVGQAMDCAISCHNLSWRSCQPFAIQESLPFLSGKTPHRTVCPVVPAHASLTLHRSVTPAVRGFFRLEPIRLRSVDPAGFFYRVKTISLPEPILIYPTIHPLPPISLQESDQTVTSQEDAPAHQAGFSQDFFGIRDYQPSDGMRFIHWKSTARFHHLMVREFEKSTRQTILILVDGQMPRGLSQDRPQFESIISIAASLCRHFQRSRVSLAVLLGGKAPVRLFPKNIEQQMNEAMVGLAQMIPGDTSLAELLAASPELSVPHSTVFCFSLSAPQALQDALAEQLDRGADIRWFMAQAPSASRAPSSPHTTHSLLQPVIYSPDLPPEQLFLS